jgi:chromate transporter
VRLGLLEIGLIFARRGGLVFGGAANIGPTLEAELVGQRQAISRDDFWLTYGLAQMMPSIILANLAISLGFKLRGPLGAVAALAGLLVPSFATAMTLTLLFLANQDLALLQTGMRALLPAVIGIVAVAALKLARSHAGRPANLLLIGAVAGGLVVGVSPLLLILGAGLCGALLMRPTDAA